MLLDERRRSRLFWRRTGDTAVSGYATQMRETYGLLFLLDGIKLLWRRSIIEAQRRYNIMIGGRIPANHC